MERDFLYLQKEGSTIKERNAICRAKKEVIERDRREDIGLNRIQGTQKGWGLRYEEWPEWLGVRTGGRAGAMGVGLATTPCSHC